MASRTASKQDITRLLRAVRVEKGKRNKHNHGGAAVL